MATDLGAPSRGYGATEPRCASLGSDGPVALGRVQRSHVAQTPGSGRPRGSRPRVQLHSLLEASYQSGQGRNSVGIAHLQVDTA